MNNDDLKSLLRLWNQKKNCLLNVFEMTKEIKFTVAEEDVERIYNFFQKRQQFFNQIEKLELSISKIDTAGLEKNVLYRDVENVKSDIKKIVRGIIELDEKNRVIMNKLMAYIKKNMRDLKVSEQIKQGYDGYYSSFSNQSSFDSRQ